jgi:hypothetical protein
MELMVLLPIGVSRIEPGEEDLPEDENTVVIPNHTRLLVM